MNTSRDTGDPLTELEANVVQVGKSAPDVRRAERRMSIQARVVLVLSALIALASAGVSAINSAKIAENSTKAAITQEGLKSLASANEELRNRGLPEIPEPKDGESLSADAVAAAAAAMLKADIIDDPRFKGPEGDAGEPGKTGRSGDTGGRGRDGQRGSEGQTGAPGGEGPAGSSGPKGDKGDQGDKGEQGDKGDKGDKGDPALQIVDIRMNCNGARLAVRIMFSDGSELSDFVNGTFVCTN